MPPRRKRKVTAGSHAVNKRKTRSSGESGEANPNGVPIAQVTNPPAAHSQDDVEESQPRIVIDHTAFPHIIQNIMTSGSLQSFVAFRSTCRAYCDLIDNDLHTLIIKQVKDSVLFQSPRGFVYFVAGTSHEVPYDWRRAPQMSRTLYKFFTEPSWTIAFHGLSSTVAVLGALDVLVLPPDCDYMPLTTHTVEFWPDKDGRIPELTPLLYFPTVIMRDNWRIKTTGSPFEMDNSPRPHILVNYVQENLVYLITGSGSSRLVSTPPGNCDNLVYDFKKWSPPMTDRPVDEWLSTTGIKNPRFCNLVAHIGQALKSFRVYNVLIDGLHVVDRQWLDPLYVSGEPWSLSPLGSKRGGRRIPFAKYLRMALDQYLTSLTEDETKYLRHYNLMVISENYSWEQRLERARHGRVRRKALQ